MSMFETSGKEASGERKSNTLIKLERMRTALSHHEPDRVPISDFSDSAATATSRSGRRVTRWPSGVKCSVN